MIEALLQGFEKYYNTLANDGYIDISHVNRLIVASWIYDVLNGQFNYLVTNEQYRILDSLYQCIEGDCLIPYQNYCHEFDLNKTSDSNYIRATETVLLNNSKERFLEGTENDIRTL